MAERQHRDGLPVAGRIRENEAVIRLPPIAWLWRPNPIQRL